MREICLDEGILQSYLDGELSLEMTEGVVGHIAVCSSCAEMVREAEGELAIFNTAFAAELAQPVPSEQLRVRINQAIDALETPATPSQDFQQVADSGWRAWLGTFTAMFTPQRAAGFASLIALAAFMLIFNAVYRNNPGPGTTVAENPSVAVNVPAGPIENPSVASGFEPQPSPEPSPESTPVQDKTRRRNNPANTGGQYALASNRIPGGLLKTTPSSPTNMTPDVRPMVTELPGEKSYLRTIASLTTAIDTNSSLTMQPTLRAEYERNLALVNQAISATRPLALSKPGDPNAAQFLYSAYQSKIDLLSAIADRQSEAIARR
jgi:anti-sigma factor RsiW